MTLLFFSCSCCNLPVPYWEEKTMYHMKRFIFGCLFFFFFSWTVFYLPKLKRICILASSVSVSVLPRLAGRRDDVRGQQVEVSICPSEVSHQTNRGLAAASRLCFHWTSQEFPWSVHSPYVPVVGTSCYIKNGPSRESRRSHSPTLVLVLISIPLLVREDEEKDL